jgi:hypothetical protein
VATEAEKLVEGTMRKIAAILLYAGYIVAISLGIALLFAFVVQFIPWLRPILFTASLLIGAINGSVSYWKIYKRLRGQ